MSAEAALPVLPDAPPQPSPSEVPVDRRLDRTCRLVTLGCKVNQYETQRVLEALEQNGYREAIDDEPADLCIVNTCTVTHTGDSKSRQVIRQLARANPGCRTIVMGCYATHDPEAIRDLPNVFEVVTDKRELPDVLDRLGIVDMPEGITRFEGRRRAYVKVQDGCILTCRYCIIPQVRPGLRSRDPERIVEEVATLIDNGYREIVVCGIHVGHFGVDKLKLKADQKPDRLWNLIEKLDRIPGEWRMRLSSIESAELNDEFIDIAANSEHLCEQFHPALQSGSDGVLRRMRRRYSVEKFLETLDRMRSRLDRPAFATDALVGFPGETEAEFEETLDTCRRAGFMKVHVFPFSARRGTPAADDPDQISPPVKKERVKRLSELERELAQQFYSEFVGEPLQVMVERESMTRPGWLRGTDRRYIPVEFPGSPELIGSFANVIGAAAHRDRLDARPLDVDVPDFGKDRS